MRDNFDKFVNSCEVLTLCVVAENAPYCANSFYAYDGDNSCLVIAGNSTSKHIKFGLNSEISGAIFTDTTKIKSIKGIQFCGILKDADSKDKRLYYKKFPFALLHKGDIFTIEINWAKFTDNSVKFGFKEIWQRQLIMH